MKRQWTRVTHHNPCAVCGKRDYCCRSGSLILCMRVESQRPSGCRLGGWLHTGDSLAGEPMKEYHPTSRPVINWDHVAFQMATAGKKARQELSEKLGVSVHSLEMLGVGSGFDEYRNLPFTSWPELNAAGKVVGIIRRYDDGDKKTMRWSKHGLYYHNIDRRGPVHIVEGGSDTAALITLDLNVIGRPSSMGGLADLAEMLQFWQNRVVVIGERDEKPGQRGTHPSCLATCTGCGRCWPGMVGARETAKRLAAKIKRPVWSVICGDKDSRAWMNNRPNADGRDFAEAVRWWTRSTGNIAIPK